MRSRLGLQLVPFSTNPLVYACFLLLSTFLYISSSWKLILRSFRFLALIISFQFRFPLSKSFDKKPTFLFEAKLLRFEAKKISFQFRKFRFKFRFNFANFASNFVSTSKNSFQISLEEKGKG